MFHSCPVCASGSIRLRFTGFSNRNPADGKAWPVFECLSCRHGFVNPRPSAEDLNAFYDSAYEAYDERHAAEADDATVIAKAMSAGNLDGIPLPEGKRVLDLGCGGGYFLNLCRQLGAMVQGIEPSQHGAAIARGQGIPVFEGTLEDFLSEHGEERFDIITSHHVLEHVPDPVGTLTKLRSLLTDGGLMKIMVPNADSPFALKLGADWHSVDLPIHLHQFSEKSLVKAAANAGLSTIDVGTVSLPAGIAHSLQLHLRRRYKVPQRISSKLPGINLIGAHLAKLHDAGNQGEALVAKFAA
jgi:2-polyprenyl-3-methyl-5-hydroxy-6-metoxy-1,4-benzoquinol methylase